MFKKRFLLITLITFWPTWVYTETSNVQNINAALLFASREFNVPFELVKAVAYVESSFNPYALHLSSRFPIGWKLRKEKVSYYFYKKGRKYHYIVNNVSYEESLKLIRWAIKHRINIDIGLMQINIAKIKDLQKKNPKVKPEDFLDPFANAIYGSFILKSCFKRYRSIGKMLECYHQGTPQNGQSLYVQLVVNQIVKNYQ